MADIKEKVFFYLTICVGLFFTGCAIFYFWFGYDTTCIRVGVTLLFVWMGSVVYKTHNLGDSYNEESLD